MPTVLHMQGKNQSYGKPYEMIRIIDMSIEAVHQPIKSTRVCSDIILSGIDLTGSACAQRHNTTQRSLDERWIILVHRSQYPVYGMIVGVTFNVRRARTAVSQVDMGEFMVHEQCEGTQAKFISYVQVGCVGRIGDRCRQTTWPWLACAISPRIKSPVEQSCRGAEVRVRCELNHGAARRFLCGLIQPKIHQSRNPQHFNRFRAEPDVFLAVVQLTHPLIIIQILDCELIELTIEVRLPLRGDIDQGTMNVVHNVPCRGTHSCQCSILYNAHASPQ